MPLKFTKLNNGWNADPNTPEPTIESTGCEITFKFFLNAFAFPEFEKGEIGFISFKNCSKYRLGPTNDEGWYLGQCRFSKLLPEWGEFYEMSGERKLMNAPADWKEVCPEQPPAKHYLFYLRDNTFECVADEWKFKNSPNNALLRM